ncbi:MAG: cation transporter [Bacteroidales bacterium]|nr:cation transporter [Bacteroidales bacterium]
MKKIMLLAAVIIMAAGTTLAQKPSGKEEIKIQTNLDCEACKKKIEDYMAFEKGVTAIKADVPTKVVTIEYRTNKTDESKLVAAIEKLGYKADVIEESGEEKK